MEKRWSGLSSITTSHSFGSRAKARPIFLFSSTISSTSRKKSEAPAGDDVGRAGWYPLRTMPYLETAVEIAREAGALLANYFERRVAFELKGDFDLVTEADRASEQLIVERLRSHFPTHGIMAEEGGCHESRSGYRWFVDPLDGTTNFAPSFPMFNVTLG